ncbi:MFS transporter [Pseudomonas sp. GOM7]|uniref:MFS transporter n=1 Tax=Pseudomonas sp. GOM7 TaxID=2998079 RepID=UPI00227CFC95|nr:MFS transporter [Pseudomonas sp. GOM7]WAJ37610.1 MFS transporter [Pseudomonas sp. GOM7]
MNTMKSWLSRQPQTVITATLALSMLLASIGTSIANIALPQVAEAFPAPFAQIQAVVVAYLATLTLTVVGAGRLADRHGAKPMLVLGLALFAGSSLFCALAPHLWLLVAARALQGVGAAFLMTLAMTLMRQNASEESVGRAMGLLGTVSALGTALGPALGGLLIPLGGWRALFWVQVPLALLALILAVSRLPNDPRRHEAAPASLWSMLNRELLPNLLSNLLVATVMMTTLVVGPFYLGFGLGLTPTQVGFVMAVGPLISIFSGVPSGHLVDAWGSRRVLAIGIGLLSTGSLLLALLPNAIGVAGYVLAIIVLTPGYQLFQAANNTATLAQVPPAQRGTVSGLLGLSRNLGLIAGAAVMGAVFAAAAGTDAFALAPASAMAQGMQQTFALATVMMLGAAGIAFCQRTAIARTQ